jgi:hypothetical protein
MKLAIINYFELIIARRYHVADNIKILAMSLEIKPLEAFYPPSHIYFLD